jgi:hypothetical protein
MAVAIRNAASEIAEVAARQTDEMVAAIAKNTDDIVKQKQLIESTSASAVSSNVKKLALQMLETNQKELVENLAKHQAKELDRLGELLKIDTKSLLQDIKNIAGDALPSHTLHKIAMDSAIDTAEILKKMPSDVPKLPTGVDPKIATNNSLVESTTLVRESLTKATTPELKKKATKLLFGLAVLTGIGYGGYLLIDPAVKTNKINNTIYHIIAITNKTSKSVIITYEPSLKINKDDIITISKSLSTPPINGVRQLIKRLSPVEIEIATNVNVPTTEPLSLNENKLGILKIETTYETQLNEDIGSFSTTVGGAIGSAAGGVAGGVATGAGGAVSSFFDSISSFLSSVLNSIYSNPILIGFIVFVIICGCTMLILFIYMRK